MCQRPSEDANVAKMRVRWGIRVAPKFEMARSAYGLDRAEGGEAVAATAVEAEAGARAGAGEASGPSSWLLPGAGARAAMARRDFGGMVRGYKGYSKIQS